MNALKLHSSETVPRDLTLRIDAKLWSEIARAARREGIAMEDYAREALIGRLAFDRGMQDGLAARLRDA